MTEKKRLKVAFCCATITQPYPQWIAAMNAELPFLDAANIDHGLVYEVGSAYISHARATMLRKAMDILPDVIVFLDHDLSWKPGELLKLIQTPGDVICGTYRFKKPEVEYMGTLIPGEDGYPIVRDDGCIKAQWVPAGFLKITDTVVHEMMAAYPELNFGPLFRPSHDLFNHGAHDGVWFGEDYAFSRRWNDRGGEIWIVPDIDLTHHDAAGNAYPGNFHQAMLAKPAIKKAA